MKETLNPIFEDEGNFWMSFKDFKANFRAVNVCRVRNWQCVRIRGKYLRTREADNPQIDQVVSKWYYEFEIK